MAIVIKRKTDIAPIAEPVQLTSPEPAPKKVLKFGGAKPVVPVEDEPMTERQKNKLIEAGLMDADEEPPKVWEPLMIGDRVTITNSMFPWVKHWKPGDQGYVKSISRNKDPLGLDESGKYHTHVIFIDMPTEASRKGQTAALFRWEFEKAPVFVPEQHKLEKA